MAGHMWFLWTLFGVLIVGCLAADLGLGSLRTKPLSMRAAALWWAVWVALAGAFALVVYVVPPAGFEGEPHRAASLFAAGYIVEEALSVDNMFVFIMIFSYFAVKATHQPRVLKWGILGVLLFRGALIIAGYELISRFAWILYLFALLLVWAAYKMLTHGDEEIEPEKNPVLRFARRFFPIVDRYEESRFFTRDGGRLLGTALLVVLIVIESTDVVFALDSIPAVFALYVDRGQPDFFLIFTSNMFAILGLRALFFVVSGAMEMFRFLKVGVAAILFFIAGKTLVQGFLHVGEAVSLAIIGGILGVAVIASLAAEPEAKPVELKEEPKKLGPTAPAPAREGAAPPPAEPASAKAVEPKP